ncbi:hypothetical protein TNCT_370201 [Trichonephila clavata]|uniref:Uncharacterized protein n=1 Tax=Trichonephila clavata TaxID=2740835 RepID=A0A8X6J1A8_TRICU|nr:hypothetical protein TNCT_370201 [Trichonephila clavata]
MEIRSESRRRFHNLKSLGFELFDNVERLSIIVHKNEMGMNIPSEKPHTDAIPQGSVDCMPYRIAALLAHLISC